MNATLINVSTRPIELHLTDGVVVLPPRARISCGDTDLDLGQVQALHRQGALRTLAEDEQNEPDEQPAKPAHRTAARRGAVSKKPKAAQESPTEQQ